MKEREHQTLEELAARSKAGDEEATERIFAASRNMLKSKANLYFMVGADRDDVLQEGMIGLMYAIRNFDAGAGASFKTFAELCVKRRIINAVKMAGRKKHTPLNDSISINEKPEHDEAYTNIAGGVNPEEIVLYADLLDYVEKNAEAIFSNMEREVWGAYIAGNNAARIAETLGRPSKSVDNALTRIRAKIEKLISA
ncbi:RNA polymerase factor sigma-70 [Clostridia bacterium]|nr:RNA polymerase factor sigma-70 [Clostridia bacterium]